MAASASKHFSTVLTYETQYYGELAKHAQAVAVDKTEFYCPMHPQQKSDKPDNCPFGPSRRYSSFRMRVCW